MLLNRWHRFDSREMLPRFQYFLSVSFGALETQEQSSCRALNALSFVELRFERKFAGVPFLSWRCRCACRLSQFGCVWITRNDCLYFVVIFDSHQDTHRLGNCISPRSRSENEKECETWNVRCNHSHTIDCSLHQHICASFTTSNVNFICFTIHVCANFPLPLDFVWFYRRIRALLRAGEEWMKQSARRAERWEKIVRFTSWRTTRIVHEDRGIQGIQGSLKLNSCNETQ